MSDEELTPLRKQYLDLKARYPDTLLFFRLGDFYETFDHDAEIVAQELDIVLTSRPVAKGQRIPMAGVPHHAVESYIARLIEKGYRVAIAEQLGEPNSRGPMERVISRVVTPGTLIDPTLLDDKRSNYLAAVIVEGQRAGLAYADISTGQFATTQLEDEGEILAAIRRELTRLQVREVLIPKVGSWKERDKGEPATRPEEALAGLSGAHLTPWPLYRFEEATARQLLLDHFGARTLAGFGCEGKPLAVRAAGAALAYLQETQQGLLPQITGLTTYTTERFMMIDTATWRNLELTETLRGEKRGSLLGVLDETLTPMGGRLLRARLAQPLLEIPALEARLDQVQALVDDGVLRAQVRQALKGLPDLERMTNRVLAGRASPRDLLGIRRALEAVPALQALVGAAFTFTETGAALDPLPELAGLIAQALVDEPPAQVSAGGLIRPGFSAELDGIIVASQHARDWIAGLESKERARTGIKNLKVGYNKVFGYYIELTKANLDSVPPEYIRKQTLVNAERFITPELKEYEALVLNAEERITELETRLFRELCARVGSRAAALLKTATALAELDVAAALAEVAVRQRYVRPTFTEAPVLRLVAGRHPVVERTLKEPFVPNDLTMDAGSRIHVITGPNMAGKCLTPDTFILTRNGLVPLGNLVAQDAPLHSFTPLEVGVYGLKGLTYTSHSYKGGVQSVLRVRTAAGFELTGTPEHSIWVRRADGSEGWVKLGYLTLTDYAALKPGTELWGSQKQLPEMSHIKGAIQYSYPIQMNQDLAYFMGLLVGDGNFSRRNGVRITSADEEIGQEFCRIAQELFGYSPKHTQKRGTPAKDYLITSLEIRQFLFELGLKYVCAPQKEIPPIILQSPREIVIAFLQGLFDTDAHADSRYGNIEFSTASVTLAHQVQLTLLNLGIISTLHEKVTAARPSFRVSIRGAQALAFYQIIGFRLPRKQKQQHLAADSRRPNIGGIPYLETTLKAIQKRIVATPDKAVALKRVKSINSIFYTYIPTHRNLSYKKLEELTAYCHQNGIPCPEIDGLLERRYFYDKVVSIEPLNECQVYDLSVPEGHAYVAAGFISHNSVYLRQTALIVLMAQIGSFVPADAAEIGLVDRIFTRIGASDELAAGQSTFMVEMVETANILNHATPRSLLILDEVGRGTSTYDGMAIAWAVVEYLHNHPERRARTLFATHYHELIELAEHLPHVQNFNLQVAEEGHEVIFLHKVAPGGADRSYGIHVARLAGIPAPVIHRAETLLQQLESGEFRPGQAEPEPFQPLLIAQEHPVVTALRTLDVNSLTPLDALTRLYEWQKLVTGEGGKKRKR